MKAKMLSTISLCMLLLSIVSCGNDTASSAQKVDTVQTDNQLTEQTVTYSADGVTMNSYVAYDSTRRGELPIVLVAPEWWGLNDYVKMRARQLAGLGYLAMAIDLYGSGVIAGDPNEAKN